MASSSEYDHLFKLSIIGESGVGKSSSTIRFTDDRFWSSNMLMSSVDFRFRKINVDEKVCKLQIWDTAG